MKKSEDRILVLTYWPYQDALIQTYTLPYLKIITENPRLELWLICLQPKSKFITTQELVNIQKTLDPFRINLIVLNYRPLSMIGLINTGFIFLKLLSLTIKLGIGTIHAWATPAGALGYLIARLLKRKLVLDSYEPHAEAMVENGTWKNNGLPFKLLFWLEKRQTHFARVLIAATEGMKQYAQLKYNKTVESNFFVKPACVDLVLFDHRKKDHLLKESLGLKEKIVGIYAGKFGGIYLDKEFFAWLKIADEYWGDKFRLLLLTSHSDGEILDFCNQFKIDKRIITKKFLPHSEVPRYMALADFALSPIKPVPSKRYCTPIKDGEYWAMGLPIIIPQNISDDSGIIKREHIGYVFEALNDAEYHRSLLVIDQLILDSTLPERIREVAKKYRSFEIARKIYQHVYTY